MSFTTTIKEEISRIPNTRSESIAELSGFFRNNGTCTDTTIDLVTENATVAKRIYQLIKDLYDITCEIENRKSLNFSKNNLYLIMINEKVNFILKDLSIINENGDFLDTPNEFIVDSEDEIRAYLRGAFLAKGSINDPKTARYHLELLIEELEEAKFISNLLNSFDLNSKILSRDKGYMVYIKESEKIGDFLRIINANQAVLYYEDIRIYRDHKNMTNRLNNCEQANIDKVVETATKQIEDIEYLKENLGIELLDEKTKEAIEYRLKYPESSLLELSEIISYETGKPITKSGLNHRFRKVRELANKMKEGSNNEN
ncbi:MAG: DNA-binding protein WhiA [Tenericutes bacterium]|nr:DNA-binding protein WhiA [Mycoplasmatota bacterium]